MDQIAIGKFIAEKRKEQNLTQEQLAERLGVSNKTISKWETAMGIAFQALSHTLGGSNVKDFLSGLLLGLSIAEMLAGVYVVAKGSKRK